MELHNIYNGGLFQPRAGKSQNSGGRAEQSPVNATRNLPPLKAASFQLEFRLYAETEFRSQANAVTAFSSAESEFEFAPLKPGKDSRPPPAAPAESNFGENGFWGATRTAARIADFVLAGAGTDLEKLRAGREGILRGLQEAEKIWGGTLPDLSYRTMEKALEQIDQRLGQLKASIIDLEA